MSIFIYSPYYENPMEAVWGSNANGEKAATKLPIASMIDHMQGPNNSVCITPSNTASADAVKAKSNRNHIRIRHAWASNSQLSP